MCVVRSNCNYKHAFFFYENHADMNFVTPLLLSKNIGNNIFDDGSPPDVCSLVFTKACEERLSARRVFTRVHQSLRGKALRQTCVHSCSPKPARKGSPPDVCSLVFTKACEERLSARRVFTRVHQSLRGKALRQTCVHSCSPKPARKGYPPDVFSLVFTKACEERLSARCVFTRVHQSLRGKALSECKPPRWTSSTSTAKCGERWKLYWHSTAKFMHYFTENFCPPPCAAHEGLANVTHRWNVTVTHPAHSASWTCGHV